ncbi:hypothetical protein LK07_25905 [Streptomyces pluripotens]|uniref:AG2 protein n=1 Tax=Streptomyces pluripotens TaxID=1355015 RepID=A0A221P3Q2_9ACTN|nr:DUF6571 family protein [Streptomyces pluripotens]ARP72634.1 hypothetical protein LK06_024735 [Streptomyces pluripotens]ASN26889.1 hypothetical protein LK07_25905 [Streptomyces pluripotens]
MTLTFTDFIEVDLSTLASAVSDWKKSAHGLEKSAEFAREGIQARSDSARWTGLNATVTREFVANTAKEVSDLHAEATSICQVLDDGHTELVALQQQIRAVVEVDAPRLGLRVEDIGSGAVRCFFPHARGDSDERTQDQLDDRSALEERINRILARADEVDASVARALAKSHGNDRHNAGHRTYRSLNEAEAERAVELARRGDRLSSSELHELNQLLRFNSAETDGEFATEFCRGLGGPREVLQLYAEMSIDGTGTGTAETRLDEVRDLQEFMGCTLANATDPDHKHHLDPRWGDEFRRLGTQRIGWAKRQWNTPYGYQVLGGLLRYGNYDSRFLCPIAEHITQLHKEDPYFFLSNKSAGSPDTYGFNPSGALGSGNEPLNSVLEALGHSPDAAQRFFTTPPTVYGLDGTVRKDGTLGFGSYLDLFTDEDFEWTIDTNDTNILADEDKTKTALKFGPKAFGHALEAATTGRPCDGHAIASAVRHSEAQAQLVTDVINKFGQNPHLIKRNENGDLEDMESGPLHAMRESLGDISAEYMGDFQRAMYREGDSDLFPTFGTAADLDSGNAQRFLGAVGQDPHAYSAITSAQQAYTSQVVDHTINGHSTSNVSLDGRVGNAVAPGAAIAGIMSDARANAVYEYHSAKDAEFNEAGADKQKWVNRLLGMGLERIGELAPIAGAPLEWTSEDIQESVIKSIEHDTASQAELQAGNEYSRGRNAAINSVRIAVNHALAKNLGIDLDTASDLHRAARVSAGNSHSVGAQWNSEGSTK